MDDLIKSLKGNLHDRATSPLSGAFLVSWIVCNWEIILVTFSDSYIYDKLFHLRNLIEQAGWINLLIYPLLGAVFFIGVYPVFAYIAYVVTRMYQNLFKKAKIKFDEETPISKEEAAKLIAEVHKIKNDHEKESEELHQKIREMENAIQNNAQQEYISAQRQIELDQVENKYPEETLMIISKINDAGEVVKESLYENEEKKTLLSYIIDDLIKRNLIKHTKVENDGKAINKLELTHEGKRLYLTMSPVVRSWMS